MEHMDELEFEEIRIAVPWGHLAGRWFGNREVRPVLVIHGWLDNLGSWNKLLPLLPRHLGYLCIDLPGHGHSSRLPAGIPYHVLSWVDIIPRIMHAYNWDKVSLMGHSLGALLCYRYVAAHPKNVDFCISIDVINQPFYSDEHEIRYLGESIEKILAADKREMKGGISAEPPIYTYEQMQQLLAKQGSVELENCHHLLDRNIIRSEKYPNKFFFSHDVRSKYYLRLLPYLELDMALVRHMGHTPLLLVKSAKSLHVTEKSMIVVDLMREVNSLFELHIVQGTHHLHLNNAEEVAALLRRFINRYRPATLNSWTIDEPAAGSGKTKDKKLKRVRFQRSKL